MPNNNLTLYLYETRKRLDRTGKKEQVIYQIRTTELPKSRGMRLREEVVLSEEEILELPENINERHLKLLGKFGIVIESYISSQLQDVRERATSPLSRYKFAGEKG